MPGQRCAKIICAIPTPNGSRCEQGSLAYLRSVCAEEEAIDIGVQSMGIRHLCGWPEVLRLKPERK